MIWHKYKSNMTFSEDTAICIWDAKKNSWQRVTARARKGQFLDDRGRFYNMDNVTHVGIIEAPEPEEIVKKKSLGAPGAPGGHITWE